MQCNKKKKNCYLSKRKSRLKLLVHRWNSSVRNRKKFSVQVFDTSIHFTRNCSNIKEQILMNPRQFPRKVTNLSFWLYRVLNPFETCIFISSVCTFKAVDTNNYILPSSQQPREQASRHKKKVSPRVGDGRSLFSPRISIFSPLCLSILLRAATWRYNSRVGRARTGETGIPDGKVARKRPSCLSINSNCSFLRHRSARSRFERRSSAHRRSNATA